MSFAEYAQHGWVLVPLERGSKGPRGQALMGWSLRENCVDDVARAAALEGAGLCHAYSGTCAIDIDDLASVTEKLYEHGVDITELLNAPDAVRIERGDPNRTKLLYALPDPLPTIKPVAGLELRCASRRGRTLQDVLPPSVHPSGEPYRWVYGDELLGDWRALPPLPAPLRAFWESRLVAPAADLDVAEATADELTRLLEHVDPDCGYDDWVRVGMALHHACSGADAGLQLWDRWSSQGDKYQGYRDLREHWLSFRTTGEGEVTANYLRGLQVATPDDFSADGPVSDPFAEVEAEKAAEAASRFALVPISDWAEQPPLPWLVEDLLPQADIAMVYGPSGSGKTFWALDLALTIASGRTWCERDTVSGPVAWVAAEAAGSLRTRAKAYAAVHNIDLRNADLHVTGETPDMANPTVVQALITACAAVNPVLVVIDTLAAASGGSNENSGEDMNRILAACRAMHAATGALVLLVHHSGKDAARGARGWSGIKAAMDTEIEIAAFADDNRVARVTKQRDGETGLAFGFRLNPISDSCTVEHGDFYENAGDGIAKLVKGEVQQIVYDTAMRLMPMGTSEVSATELRDVAAGKLVHTGDGRDQRKPRVTRAINAMISQGVFESRNGMLMLPLLGLEDEF